jgi:hypothetical protein
LLGRGLIGLYYATSLTETLRNGFERICESAVWENHPWSINKLVQEQSRHQFCVKHGAFKFEVLWHGHLPIVLRQPVVDGLVAVHSFESDYDLLPDSAFELLVGGSAHGTSAQPITACHAVVVAPPAEAHTHVSAHSSAASNGSSHCVRGRVLVVVVVLLLLFDELRILQLHLLQQPPARWWFCGTSNSVLLGVSRQIISRVGSVALLRALLLLQSLGNPGVRLGSSDDALVVVAVGAGVGDRYSVRNIYG